MDRPARPTARVVDDEVEAIAAGIDRGEQPFDLICGARVAGDGGRADFAREGGKLLRVARRQHHIHALASAFAGQRGAQSRSGPDDQR